MNQSQPITVGIFGIGPIGAEIARLLLKKKWARLTAAVDIDPSKTGKDLGEVLGLGERLGVPVTQALETAPQVVCHSTSSRLQQVQDQLASILRNGSHVVSTCEELAFPLDDDIRASLDRVATEAKVALLGTGVNPGFVMDKLPLTLSAVCQEVTSIEVFRYVDASRRREPLQRKVGAGMTEDEFRSAVGAGKIKHMGLRESLMMVAHGLGAKLAEVSDERIEPMMATADITTDYLTVRSGQVAGVHQTIFGKGTIDISLELKMYVGAQQPADRVIIRGIPDVTMEIAGGVHGDRATAAMVVNCIPRLLTARPGVLTMDDIPVSFH